MTKVSFPRYLAMVGQDAKAERILARINGADEAKKILNDIKNTVTEKKEKHEQESMSCECST